MASSLADEARELVAGVVSALQELLEGAPSRWNGVVVLDDLSLNAGSMRPDGTIVLLLPLWERGGAARHRLVIHESLHTLSPWTTPEYRDGKGWEEGVVEQLQRLLRQAVLDKMGLSIPEGEFASADLRHPFNPYIAELEALRERLSAEPVPFYRRLLRLPIPERVLHLASLGDELTAAERSAFRQQLAVANVRLRRPIYVF
jgi:hypothetical protein